MVLSCCSQLHMEFHISDNNNEGLDDCDPDHDDTCNDNNDDSSYHPKIDKINYIQHDEYPVKKVTHGHIVLLLANERKTIASMNKQSYDEALQERGSAVQRGKDDAQSIALSTLQLHMIIQTRLNHMMIHDGSWIVQTFEDIVESWANLVNPTAEDCHCIF